jgi:transposase-like protein
MMNRIPRRAALTAAAAATITSTVAGAGAAQASTVVVVNTDDLAAESRRLHAAYVEAQRVEQELAARLAEQLTGTQRTLLSRLAEAQAATQCHLSDFEAAEIARHLPAMASVIRLLHLHTTDVAQQQPGACCTVAAGFTP